MADYIVPGEQLSDIADAIRSKTKTIDPITVSDMPTKILNIQGSDMPLSHVMLTISTGQFSTCHYLENTGIYKSTTSSQTSFRVIKNSIIVINLIGNKNVNVSLDGLTLIENGVSSWSGDRWISLIATSDSPTIIIENPGVGGGADEPE